jgi:hypothetical protein
MGPRVRGDDQHEIAITSKIIRDHRILGISSIVMIEAAALDAGMETGKWQALRIAG